MFVVLLSWVNSHVGEGALDLSKDKIENDLRIVSPSLISKKDREKIISLFQKFEFISLLKRLPEFAGNPSVAMAQKKTTASKQPRSKGIRPFDYLEVKTAEEVKEIVENIKNKKQ
jgi:hypothetical protein